MLTGRAVHSDAGLGAAENKGKSMAVIAPEILQHQPQAPEEGEIMAPEKKRGQPSGQ